jgi:hypothetical protein
LEFARRLTRNADGLWRVLFDMVKRERPTLGCGGTIAEVARPRWIGACPRASVGCVRRRIAR